MTQAASGGAPRVKARIAGLLYLIVVITSSFALYVASTLIVRGDAAATAASISASTGLFRLGFTANLIAAAAYVAVVAMLYDLFKPAGRTLSIVAAFLGLAGCAVSAAAMIHQFAPLYLLGGDEYLAVIPAEQTQAHARLALRMSALGNSIGLVFFGFYCLTLGCLVLRARFMPRVLGLFLLFAGAGWLVGNLSTFLAPDFARAFATPLTAASGIGELLFALWLLAMGVDPTKWREQAAA